MLLASGKQYFKKCRFTKFTNPFIPWNHLNEVFTDEDYERHCSTSSDSPQCRFRKVTHCIFDLDGTILDSEEQYHNMIEHLLKKHGKTYSKGLREQLYGGTDKQICQKIFEVMKLPIPLHAFEQEVEMNSAVFLPDSPFKPGVERFVKHLHDHNVEFALATNSKSNMVQLYETKKPDFFSMFSHKVCVDDSELLRGKPFPDIFLLAASRFKCKPKPKDCLAFEDSLTGVQAAREAGMQVVLVSKTLTSFGDLKPTLVIPSFTHLKPELFGLPPFPKDEGNPVKSSMRI